MTALNDVYSTVKKGGIFGSLGSNRASKTTIIHIIATLLKPTSGKVLVSGIVASENHSSEGKDWNSVSRPKS